MLRKIFRFLLPSQVLYSVILFIVMLSVLWIYKDIDHSFSKIERDYLQLQSQDIKEFSHNISKHLKKIILDNPLKELSKNPNLEEKLNQILALFSTKHYRFVYILYRDNQGKLRYLADGSYEKEQRGIFRQKFDPESDRWQEALQSGKTIHVLQGDFTGLWSTYYYPLDIWKNKRYLLVFDISLQALKGFKAILLPFKNLLKVISIVLIILFFMSLLWSILFYLQRRKTSIDPLTRLYNRNMLHEVKRHLDLRKTSVILADLDHFKRINDRYGHNAGDIVLQHTARSLMRTTRPEDILIRYGGEEFLILLNGIDTKEALMTVAKRIHDEFSKNKIHYKDQKLDITLSMGIVSAQTEMYDLSEIITIADKMLYIAKTSGRNKFVIYGEETSDTKRVLLYPEVMDAIMQGGLFFLYQPIYDTKTLKTQKYEVLARLQDKQGFIYSPDEFIPTIRGTTAYRDLSKLLIQTAFEKMTQTNIELSINFDINDFMDETLFEELYDILKNQEALIKRLTIELLEESPVLNLEGLIKKVNRLKKIGIQIAIDDFGKGYAGLNYILNFHPHILKIDRSIVSKIFDHPYIPAVTEAIITTCRNIGIKTVAEGIEDEKVLKKMRDLGFDSIQGYYLSRPLLWKDVEKHLQNSHIECKFLS